jgi:hypothetical protein
MFLPLCLPFLNLPNFLCWFLDPSPFYYSSHYSEARAGEHYQQSVGDDFSMQAHHAFMLGGDHEQDPSKFGNSWHGIDIVGSYPNEA